MAGAVYHDVSTLTLNGHDIRGQSNVVEVNRARAEVAWANFSDDSQNKDAGPRNESIRVTAVYTEGANEAEAVVHECYEGTLGGGLSGTIDLIPLAGGDAWKGVGKITEANINFTKAAVGTLSFTLAVNGTIART